MPFFNLKGRLWKQSVRNKRSIVKELAYLKDLSLGGVGQAR